MKARLMARVAGRVIAHKLGHYLLGTSAHSPTGLMRASFSSDVLVGPGESQFITLEPDQRSALVCRMAAAR
jgi:hypothetical protein